MIKAHRTGPNGWRNALTERLRWQADCGRIGRVAAGRLPGRRRPAAVVIALRCSGACAASSRCTACLGCSWCAAWCSATKLPANGKPSLPRRSLGSRAACAAREEQDWHVDEIRLRSPDRKLGCMTGGMSSLVPLNRDQAFLLTPDLKPRLPGDDMMHFVPRPMLALLIHRHANSTLPWRRIERATHRDVAVRFAAADLRPGHDTIATLHRASKAAISAANAARFGEAAFLHVPLLAREAGLLRLGMASADGAKLDATASKMRSVRGVPALREGLAISATNGGAVSAASPRSLPKREQLAPRIKTRGRCRQIWPGAKR